MERICPGAKLLEGFTTARSLLLACVLVATFEQPIGHSLDSSFIMRNIVSWCPHYYHSGAIMITEQVVNGRTGDTVGAAKTTDYAVTPLEKGTTPAPPANSEWIP